MVAAGPPPFIRHVPGWEVIVTTRRFQHHIEVILDQSLEHYALNFAQYRTLELIAQSRPIHIAELARRMRLTRQAVQVSVRKLQLLGALDIERDRNTTLVFLSDVGRRRIRHYRRAAGDTVASIERRLTAADRDTLVSLMRAADEALMPDPVPPWWLQD